MNLSIFNLNLHGYHPMGAPRRYREDHAGRIRLAGSYPSGEPLSCFTTDELDHGNRLRLDRLAADLHRLAPDIICLQEVAAGCPWKPRDRAIFEAEVTDDWFEGNSALRLSNRLNALGDPYVPILACRGNVGWYTSESSCANERIVTFNGTEPNVVFDFDANPYPEGLLIEGLALLVRPPWEAIGRWTWDLPINFKGDRVFVQAAAIRHGPAEDAPWFVIVNVHLGHKLANFEQAIALREALRLYRFGAGDCPGAAPEACRGSFISGDFNAQIYRPASGGGDLSMIPWEMHVPGQFDFRPAGNRFGDLLTGLWALNDDGHYKPWASVRDPAEAQRRIHEAATQLFTMPDDAPLFQDALLAATAAGRVRGVADLPWAASVPERIDYILADPKLPVKNSCVVYPENSWSSCDGTSDHPALYAEYDLGGG